MPAATFRILAVICQFCVFLDFMVLDAYLIARAGRASVAPVLDADAVIAGNTQVWFAPLRVF